MLGGASSPSKVRKLWSKHTGPAPGEGALSALSSSSSLPAPTSPSKIAATTPIRELPIGDYEALPLIDYQEFHAEGMLTPFDLIPDPTLLYEHDYCARLHSRDAPGASPYRLDTLQSLLASSEVPPSSRDQSLTKESKTSAEETTKLDELAQSAIQQQQAESKSREQDTVAPEESFNNNNNENNIDDTTKQERLQPVKEAGQGAEVALVAPLSSSGPAEIPSETPSLESSSLEMQDDSSFIDDEDDNEGVSAVLALLCSPLSL